MGVLQSSPAALHAEASTLPVPANIVSVSLAVVLGLLIVVRRLIKGGLLRGGRMTSSWPSLAAALPAAGMLPAILLNLHRLHDWAAKELEERGRTAWVRGPWFLGSKDFVATVDPVVTRYVSSTKSSNFQRGDRFREIVEPLGVGVITADSDEWRSRRKVMVDLLHRPEFVTSLRRMTQQMLQSRLLPRLADAAREKKPVNLEDMVLRFTFDVMCSAILGVDFGSLSAALPDVPFMEAFGKIEDIIITRFVMPRSLWRLLARLQLGPPQRLADYTKFADELLYRIIATRREELQHEIDGDASQRFDLLTAYLRSKREIAGDGQASSPSVGYSAEYIRDATLELLASGWRSTGVATARVLWLLIMHPSTEAEILDELAPVTAAAASAHDGAEGEHDITAFHADDVGGCVYLNAVIHEALRLYPSIPFTSRSNLQRDVLPTGEELQQGVTVLLPVFAVGRMKEIWGEDAGEFKPGRWITEEGKMKDESSYKFAAFGAGPRGCLGRRLSMATIKAAAASVVCNFRFTPAAPLEGGVGPGGEIPFESFEKMSFYVHAR